MKKIYRLLLLSSFTLSLQLLALPSQVLIIRHAEKPDDANDLNLKGLERAAALSPFFQGNFQMLDFGTPIAIYAQRPKKITSSIRPMQTVEPLAGALRININSNYLRDDYAQMVNEVKTNPSYQGHTVLISWEHKVIPDMAKLFGAVQAPEKWNGDVFDRVWKISYGTDGQVNFENVPQKLMFGDSEN